MLRKGFTLVELLIVIGLLGAIALIVIAAINPIEQANRARDARFRADGGQIISAIDRYFAAHSSFPWEDCASCTLNTDDELPFMSARDIQVGLCGDANCDTPGLLVSSDELKNEFMSRDFISKSNPGVDDLLYIGKGGSSSFGVYACFIPLSKSNREKAIAEGKVRDTSSFDSNGIPLATTSCTTAADAGWDDGTCKVCIPD